MLKSPLTSVLNSSIVKSNNDIRKVNDKKNLIMKQENSEIGKKVLTDGLDLCKPIK